MTTLRAAAAVMFVSAMCAASAGCTDQRTKRGYEYMPDMARSVAYDTFAPNPVTRNGMTQQPPVQGTIPRGFMPLHYTKSEADAERAGRELVNPYASTPDVIERGRTSYETFCKVCHGARGEGDGPLVPLIPSPPSYSSDRVRAMPAGRLFHVITYGSGRMPSYASQLPADDRWSIVAYVQTLQQRQESAP
jgi:mono/diheme cytochrome c family protein